MWWVGAIQEYILHSGREDWNNCCKNYFLVKILKGKLKALDDGDLSELVTEIAERLDVAEMKS